MRTVIVRYRKEADGTWIGTSTAVPGYVGHGDSFEQTRERISEGLPWFAEEDLAIAHVIPDSVDRATFKPTTGQKVRFELAKGPADRFQAMPLRYARTATAARN